jgi:hypothetical protein
MEILDMKLTEFCKRLNVSKPTALKILKEGTDRVLLSGDWYVCKSGLKLLDNLTHNKKSVLNERANYYLEDEIAITGEDNNEALINLKQIKTNVLNLINLINTNPDTNLSNIVMIFTGKETLDDIIAAINEYEQSVIQGDN